MSISWNASLPISADGHVAGDRDHRDRVEQRGADAGDEVGGARAARPEADADPAGHAGVAVGRVGAALLVADEHVAQLRVVAEDVVERQDHAAGIAEEHVDALAEERLADDVGADAGPVAAACASWSMSLRARSIAAAVGRPVGGHVAAFDSARVAGSPVIVIGPVSWCVLARSVLDAAGKQKTPAFRRGSLRSSVFGASAASSAFLRSPAGSR